MKRIVISWTAAPLGRAGPLTVGPRAEVVDVPATLVGDPAAELLSAGVTDEALVPVEATVETVETVAAKPEAADPDTTFEDVPDGLSLSK